MPNELNKPSKLKIRTMKTQNNFPGIKLVKIIILFVFVFLLSYDCKKKDAGSDANLDPIESEYSAEFIIKNLAEGVIYNKVLYSLAFGTYSNEIVNGTSGTAKMTGIYNYTANISCGTDCIRSVTNVNVTIVFDHYQVMSCTNCESIVTGTITYTDNTWSQQSGLSHTSGGSISLAGTGVAFKELIDGGSSGWNDVISFSASGDFYNMSGWCKAGNGITYNF
jgi:hypothetical protein